MSGLRKEFIGNGYDNEYEREVLKRSNESLIFSTTAQSFTLIRL